MMMILMSHTNNFNWSQFFQKNAFSQSTSTSRIYYCEEQINPRSPGTSDEFVQLKQCSIGDLQRHFLLTIAHHPSKAKLDSQTDFFKSLPLTEIKLNLLFQLNEKNERHKVKTSFFVDQANEK